MSPEALKLLVWCGVLCLRTTPLAANEAVEIDRLIAAVRAESDRATLYRQRFDEKMERLLMTDVVVLELRSCPCCGARAAFGEITDAKDPNFGGIFVTCTGCPITTDLRFSCKEDARPLLAEQWNRRHAEDEVVRFMIEHSIPTGHGDSIRDLLSALVNEVRVQENRRSVAELHTKPR